jgi:hypothetical protein
MKKWFSIAYLVLFVWALCGCTILACAWLVKGKEHIVYARSGAKPITNKSFPNEVEDHFADGKEYSQAPATSIGMKDGTCYVYTNEVSWLAMECFGTVKP